MVLHLHPIVAKAIPVVYLSLFFEFGLVACFPVAAVLKARGEGPRLALPHLGLFFSR